MHTLNINRCVAQLFVRNTTNPAQDTSAIWMYPVCIISVHWLIYAFVKIMRSKTETFPVHISVPWAWSVFCKQSNWLMWAFHIVNFVLTCDALESTRNALRTFAWTCLYLQKVIWMITAKLNWLPCVCVYVPGCLTLMMIKNASAFIQIGMSATKLMLEHHLRFAVIKRIKFDYSHCTNLMRIKCVDFRLFASRPIPEKSTTAHTGCSKHVGERQKRNISLQHTPTWTHLHGKLQLFEASDGFFLVSALESGFAQVSGSFGTPGRDI